MNPMLPTQRKPLPPITWKNIAPPYKEYNYFERCTAYPFRPTASVFDLVNAWWLSEISTLVYADEDFARQTLRTAGLADVKWFSAKSTQCCIASNTAFAILAFRGTESRPREGSHDFRDIIADLKADVDIRLVDSAQGGKVHKGFKDALDEVWEAVCAELKRLREGDRTLWVTGHSLGAALATLAGDRYGDIQGLYTFGSPRVGDAAFKDDFPVKAYRVVNNEDVVTRVPPPGLYMHVGELKYIDSAGVIHDTPGRWERWTDEIRGTMATVFNALGQVRHGFSEAIPEGLKDHVPTLYATHLWNNIP
jgi:triacylglycerol lipase